MLYYDPHKRDIPSMWQYKDTACETIESALKPVESKPADHKPDDKPAPKKLYKAIHRQAVFPTKTLESEEDINAYVENMRKTLKQLLVNCDGIKLN